MQGTLQIGRLFGISVRVHFSWAFIFVLLVLSLTLAYLPNAYPGWPAFQYWAIGVLASALLFACVLVHELSHSLEAIRRGRTVNSITLFFLGGVSHVEGESRDAGEEFWVSVVGPATSLALAGLFALLSLGINGNSAINALTQYLIYVNLMIGIFNLMPAFPLDGGRVLKALVWRSSGSENRGARVANRTGSVIGYGLIVVGIVLLFSDTLYTGIWLMIIGWFIQSAASSERRDRDARITLSGRLVRDAMRQDMPTIEPGTSIRALLDRHIATDFERAYGVVLGDTFLGLITVNDVKSVPLDAREVTWVSQAMTPESEVVTIHPDAPLEDGLGMLARRGFHQLVVMENGRPIGLLTRAGVVRVMEVSDVLSRDGLDSTHGS